MRKLMLPFLFASVFSVSAAVDWPTGPTKKDGFTIHEWGVFTYYANQTHANAGRDAAWSELPKEVFGVTDGRELPSKCVGANLPIVYFYNSDALKTQAVGGQETLRVKVPGAKKAGKLFRWSARMLSMRVDFPGGAPIVWYPKTEEPLGEWWGRGKPGGLGMAPKMDGWSRIRGNPDHLSWKIFFPIAKELPSLKCPKYSWRDAALKPNADAFSVDLYLQDLQKFIFYEGLLPNRNKPKHNILG